MGRVHRGTGEPWAVRCDACKKTDAFKKVNRPKPALVNDRLAVFYKEEYEQNQARLRTLTPEALSVFTPEQVLLVLSELSPRLVIPLRKKHVRIIDGDKPSVCPRATRIGAVPRGD